MIITSRHHHFKMSAEYETALKSAIPVCGNHNNHNVCYAPSKKDQRIWRRIIHDRELQMKPFLGCNDGISSYCYSSMSKAHSFDPTMSVHETHHGGIFNFDFSTDGSILVAACERKSILMFDPFNGALIKAKNKAHSDCVNCIKFLDSRTFVSCSDDTTVSLWDCRFLKHNIRTLRGHSNWVKNIEYDSKNGLLVTSGFDGSIYTWDINRYEESSSFKKVFHTNGLMRSKLTPDSSKLVIATAAGYLLIIHDLDLTTMSEDLHGFKPNSYRLMQMSNNPVNEVYQFNHLFNRSRNRVELVSDFPLEDDAEMIASLEVHPQGWCAVSRNTVNDESTEWTCVHDIQAPLGKNEQDFNCPSSSDIAETSEAPARSHFPSYLQLFHSRNASTSSSEPDEAPEEVSEAELTERVEDNQEDQDASSHDLDCDSSSSQSSNEYSLSEGHGSAAASQPVGSTSDNSDPRVPPEGVTRSSPVEAFSGGNFSNDSQVPPPPGQELSDSNTSHGPWRESGADERDAVQRVVFGSVSSRSGLPLSLRLGESATYIIRSGPQERVLLLGRRPYQKPPSSDASSKILRNRKRLIHYAEEPNVGKGFIKEVCFSSDGRMICSPFGFGVRLLAFSQECSELCEAVPGSPVKLYEVTTIMSHSNVVVATKFSPTHHTLVSGCLNGKVDFHQPRFG